MIVREVGGLGRPRGEREPDDRDRGLYVLVLRLGRLRRVTVGALGPLRFAPGGYLYVGSARRGLRARVIRHLRGPIRPHWHIDHLTGLSGVQRLGAVILAEAALASRGSALKHLTECALNQRVGRLPSGHPAAPGFGASDCRAGCPAHLWHLPTSPDLESLARQLGGTVLRPD